MSRHPLWSANSKVNQMTKKIIRFVFWVRNPLVKLIRDSQYQIGQRVSSVYKIICWVSSVWPVLTPSKNQFCTHWGNIKKFLVIWASETCFFIYEWSRMKDFSLVGILGAYKKIIRLLDRHSVLHQLLSDWDRFTHCIKWGFRYRISLTHKFTTHSHGFGVENAKRLQCNALMLFEAVRGVLCF